MNSSQSISLFLGGSGERHPLSKRQEAGCHPEWSDWNLFVFAASWGQHVLNHRLARSLHSQTGRPYEAAL